VGIGVVLGIWADSAFGTSPIFLVIGLVLGCVAAAASTVALVRRYL
jgi:F0F1-type ATP synthase assembly protein I